MSAYSPLFGITKYILAKSSVVIHSFALGFIAFQLAPKRLNTPTTRFFYAPCTLYRNFAPDSYQSKARKLLFAFCQTVWINVRFLILLCRTNRFPALVLKYYPFLFKDPPSTFRETVFQSACFYTSTGRIQDIEAPFSWFLIYHKFHSQG